MGKSVIKNPRKIYSYPGGDLGLDPRVTILENNEYKITYFTEISNSTGTITIPTGATILLDQFQSGADAYVSTIQNTQPTGIFPQTAGGVTVDVSSFNALGNYTLTGTPSSYPVALIYILKIKAKDYSNLNVNNILDLEEVLVDSTFGLFINGLTSKTTPVDADSLTISDSSDTNKAKKLSLTNLWTNWLKSKTDAAYNPKGFRGLYAYQNTDSSVTGSTSQTVLANIKVTGGDMGANGKLIVNATGYKSGTASNFTLAMYVSTVGTNTIGNTGVPTSSTQIGVFISAATALFVGTFTRMMVNKNSQSTNYVFPSNQSTLNDFGVNTVARTAININTANDFWVVITGQLGSAADTGGFDNIQVYIDK